MMGSSAPHSRPPGGATALPPEVEVSTPGAVLVVDDAGRLRDRSPNAGRDPELGAVDLASVVPHVIVDAAQQRAMVHEGSTLDALWFAQGGTPPEGGLNERDFGNMLHRLRNAVSILVASLETEEMVGTGPVSTRLGTTHRREMDRLVDSLGGLGHAFGPGGGRSFVDLELILRRAIDSMRGSARRRGVNLRLEGARDARRGRTGDEALLQAAVDALLHNAIDASLDGGEIRVRAEGGPASVTLVVEDDGPGLMPPNRGELGLPFATSKRGRLGLGLSIAQRAAFLHGGELHVATRAIGRGVTASLWIPTAAS
jgi:signal transduction histidine kinase